MNDNNLLSFVSDTFTDDSPDDIEPGSIWDKLMKAIMVEVKRDGIRKNAISSGQSVASVTVHASECIYYDVSEFYDWYFEEDDWAGRTQFIKSQKKATILSPLRSAVKPIVEHGLEDLRESELIPDGLDTDDIVDTVTDNLTRYILNWQDWYYIRKEEDELDDYYSDISIYKDIYINSDYGDMTSNGNYLDEYDIDSSEDD